MIFKSFGVAKNRLKFAAETSREKFLATYNQIDVALDPFPYPGGTRPVRHLDGSARNHKKRV